MAKRKRELVHGRDVGGYVGLGLGAQVAAVSGVRVYDVGQGDSIAVLDELGRPCLQVDYGGRFANPFGHHNPVASSMPAANLGLVMLTHWDEDHWCSAKMNTDTWTLPWLVPRQRTSPRAAMFSAQLADVQCIPEGDAGVTQRFSLPRKGGEVFFTKIRARPPVNVYEDCNETGVAFAIVKDGQAILLPGDAPFDDVPMFDVLRESGLMLRGVVAFHHGSREHWTRRTRKHLAAWHLAPTCDVIFSYGDRNSYGHPHTANYSTLRSGWTLGETPDWRKHGLPHYDVLF
jgi:beta-lactamase superfamily II metal-dependent hydrolase